MRISLGKIIHSFFEDYLKVQKGFQIASIRSYRDTMKLYLDFVSKDAKRRVTRLSVEDLTFERVLRFLCYLEKDRHNHTRTRNQRLAALKTFYEYLAKRMPEMFFVCEQISMIPIKRASPPQMRFLEKKEVTKLFQTLPCKGRFALRNQTLLLFLYNTGARVQEVSDLRVGLHGKGDKWRTCPLWNETAQKLQLLLDQQPQPCRADDPVFVSSPRRPLTRFGIYKIVRRCAGFLDSNGTNPRRVTPHLFRHTAAMHLLESGVEINVIRGWLGHVHLDTTYRYAEITARMKETALQLCEPPLRILSWLDSL